VVRKQRKTGEMRQKRQKYIVKTILIPAGFIKTGKTGPGWLGLPR
jgi:hypothetical protein